MKKELEFVDLKEASDYDLVDVVVERIPDLVDDDLLYLLHHVMETFENRYKERMDD